MTLYITKLVLESRPLVCTCSQLLQKEDMPFYRWKGKVNILSYRTLDCQLSGMWKN